MHLTWGLTMIRRYDFRCIKCDHVEEQWTEHDESYATCPECGDTAERIISPIRTHFVGHDWPDKRDKWAKDHERASRK